MLRCGSITLLVSTLTIYTHADTCYLPDGTEVGGLRVCDPTAPASACCAPGDECTTSGLCKAGNDAENNWMWRGPCTDQTWESEYCPRYCYNSTTSDKASSVNFKVMACSPDTYCCSYPNSYYALTGYSFDCCDDPDRAFTAGAANFLAGYSVTTKQFVGFTTVSGYATLQTTLESTTSSSTSSTEALASSVSSSASSPASVSSSSPSSSSTSSTVTSSTLETTTSADAPSQTAALPTSQTTSPSLPPASKPTLSTGASAGIGVGATIGALALVGIGIFAGLRFRRRGLRSQQAEPDDVKLHAQWRQAVYSSQVSSQEHKDARVGLSEAGWQLPSEADSIPCGELEGRPVEKGSK